MTNTNCISNIEYSLRIIIPSVNGVLGILTYIYNDDLLDPKSLKTMHIVIASVNVLAMTLSIINDSLKTRYETLKKYENEMQKFNQPKRVINPINYCMLRPRKPSFLQSILPFKTKLN